MQVLWLVCRCDFVQMLIKYFSTRKHDQFPATVDLVLLASELGCQEAATQGIDSLLQACPEFEQCAAVDIRQILLLFLAACKTPDPKQEDKLSKLRSAIGRNINSAERNINSWIGENCRLLHTTLQHSTVPATLATYSEVEILELLKQLPEDPAVDPAVPLALRFIALRAWASGRGHSCDSIWRLLQCVTEHHSAILDDHAAVTVLLCHALREFKDAQPDEIADLPLPAIKLLLQQDDLPVDSEEEVLGMLQGWIGRHSPEEVIELLSCVRLAWIPSAVLWRHLDTGMLSCVKNDAQVQRMVDEAVVCQVEHGTKRSSADSGFAEGLVCPITQEVMTDPVMAADGHTYERTAIVPNFRLDWLFFFRGVICIILQEQWLKKKGTSPNSNMELEHTILTPNHLVRKLIQEADGNEGAKRKKTRRRSCFSKLELPDVSLCQDFVLTPGRSAQSSMRPCQ